MPSFTHSKDKIEPQNLTRSSATGEGPLDALCY